MAIDPSQIDSFGVLELPVQRIPGTHTFIFEGDSWEEPIQFAESFQSDGTAVNPAPFLTDSGGWEGLIRMEGSELPVTVDNPLADDGIVTLRLGVGASNSHVGQHCGQILIANPVSGPYTEERTLTKVRITVTEKTPT